MTVKTELTLPVKKAEFFDNGLISGRLFGQGATERVPSLTDKIGAWNSGIQFSNSIRDVVSDYITSRISLIKSANPSLQEDSDKSIKDAIVDHKFWDVKTADKKKILLLLELGDAVSRIETKTRIDVLRRASAEDLAKIGLNPALRDLSIDLLPAAAAANPLFIRFTEFGLNNPDHSEQATPTTWYLPGDQKPHTIAEVFPRETQEIADSFSKIADQKSAWLNEEHAGEFRDYLLAISGLYKETDPVKAKIAQENVADRYAKLLQTGFPLVLTPGLFGYYTPPYIDPELRLSVVTPETSKEHEAYIKTRDVMAENLSEIESSEFSLSLKEAPVKSVISLGSYGVNLRYTAPGQSKPSITLFLDEQIRREDNDFPLFMGLIRNTREEFGNLPDPEKNSVMEFMCRMNTLMHEYSHLVYPGDGESSRRLGNKQTFTIIDETKADILYRGMLKTLCVKDGLTQSSKQWAIASLASALQGSTYGESDPYFYSSTYALNNLFANGAVKIEDHQFTITDYDLYFQTLKQNSLDLLRSLYQDPASNETKAANWIKENSLPNHQVMEAIQIVKERIK